MSENNEIPRRSALKTMASSAALAATSGIAVKAAHHESIGSLKGNIHHSVCKWCYRNKPRGSLPEGRISEWRHRFAWSGGLSDCQEIRAYMLHHFRSAWRDKEGAEPSREPRRYRRIF